jgi:ubiquitin C-terminal hydrolase
MEIKNIHVDLLFRPIKNIGNSCYANVILQLIWRFKDFLPFVQGKNEMTTVLEEFLTRKELYDPSNLLELIFRASTKF